MAAKPLDWSSSDRSDRSVPQIKNRHGRDKLPRAASLQFRPRMEWASTLRRPPSRDTFFLPPAPLGFGNRGSTARCHTAPIIRRGER
eukprot:SAG11_NODE_14872_length_597_cov_0.720884_1_plen_86_part_10